MNSSWESATAEEADQGVLGESPHHFIDRGARAVTHSPFIIDRIAFWALLFVVCIAPLPFGSAHDQTFLFFSLVIFSSLAMLLFGRVTHRAAGVPLSFNFRLSIYALILFCLVAVLELAAQKMLGIGNHPVVGDNLPEISNNSIESLRSILSFIAMFSLSALVIGHSRQTKSHVRSLLLMCFGIIVCIGLVHWFYDNGRLFWIFEPEHPSVSTRARWPFVNANSLAQLIVLLFAPLLVRVEGFATDLSTFFSSTRLRSIDILASAERQRMILNMTFAIFLTGAAFLVLIGTQSRASWSGFAISLILYMSIRMYILKFAHRTQISDEMPSPQKRHRRSDRHSRSFSAKVAKVLLNHTSWPKLVKSIYLPIVLAGCAAAILLLLNDVGNRIFLERLEFGLAHTMEDLRWIMYHDSLAMLKNNLWFGIGLGNWSYIYPQYVSAGIGDLNPVYLHSDPLQLIIEVGIIGCLPLVALAVFVLSRTYRAIVHCRSDSDIRLKLRTAGWVSGALGFLIASGFDFPFRIPALSWHFALVLGLLVGSIDLIESRAKPKVM